MIAPGHLRTGPQVNRDLQQADLVVRLKSKPHCLTVVAASDIIAPLGA